MIIQSVRIAIPTNFEGETNGVYDVLWKTLYSWWIRLCIPIEEESIEFQIIVNDNGKTKSIDAIRPNGSTK